MPFSKNLSHLKILITTKMIDKSIMTLHSRRRTFQSPYLEYFGVGGQLSVNVFTNGRTNVVIIGTDRDRIFIRLYLTVVNNGRNTFPISFYSHIGNGNSLVRRNDEYIHVLGNQFPNLRYLSAAVVHSIIYHQLYVAVIGGLNLHFEQYGFAPGIGGTLRKTNDVLFVSFLFGLARGQEYR